MRRNESLEKEIMLGTIEGKRRRGRQRKRWFGTIKEDTNRTFEELKNVVHNRNKWRSSSYDHQESNPTEWITHTHTHKILALKSMADMSQKHRNNHSLTFYKIVSNIAINRKV